ncbi:MAG: NAD(P)-dependent oxidoreductase, partial [Victivallales bacterium]
MSQKKILITGIAGLIGRLSWKQLSRYPEKYDLYGMDRTLERSRSSGNYLEKDSIPPERVTLTDLTDYQKVLQAVTGMDTVIQLAALASPITPWKSLLSSNIDGLYNVFEACREAGVKRIIYASSIRVSQVYCNRIKVHRLIRGRKSREILKNFKMVTHLDPPRPAEAYGVAKLFGEDLARMYSD